MTKKLKRIFSFCILLLLATTVVIFATACSENNDDIDQNPIIETKTYTVTFDVQGHGTAPSAQTVEDGGYATQPTDPSEDGYTFLGWYKEASCTNEFVFTTEKITTNTTIYAKWEELSAPTSFDATYHIYNSGYTGEINGNAYSTDNIWYYENSYTGESATYYYNEITFTGAVQLFWHIDECEAGVQYKMDIRVGEDFEQDSTIRSTYNIWTADEDGNLVYSIWNRTFGLIGLQVEFTQEQIDARLYKVILQNPANEEVTLRIICAEGDAH